MTDRMPLEFLMAALSDYQAAQTIGDQEGMDKATAVMVAAAKEMTATFVEAELKKQTEALCADIMTQARSLEYEGSVYWNGGLRRACDRLRLKLTGQKPVEDSLW